MKYHFKIHREDAGFWAECVELEGCITEADTEKKLYKYMKEALDLYLDEPEGSLRIPPLPMEKIKAKNIVKIEVDPRIAFSLYIKHLRKKHKFTQQQLADMLGMKNIYSYQRLEKKSNPSLEMLARVKKIYPEFNLNKLFE